MGSGGPGNIVHIDNLYVKAVPVKSNAAVLLGEYLIFDTDGYRTLVITDFSANDRFLNILTNNVVQAGEDANNLTTTPVKDRKTEVSVLMRGSDWVVKMAASVEPNKRCGIRRLDAGSPVIAVADVANLLAPIIDETLGVYKHKEFARQALVSVQNDNGIVSTGEV